MIPSQARSYDIVATVEKHSAENAIACAEHERAVFFANAMLTVTSTKAPVAAVSALRRWRSCCRQQADVGSRYAPAVLGT